MRGGDKLRAALANMARELGSGGSTVRVGFLEGATYPNGTSVPMVAAINEFGAPSHGQPPRPFFRRMIAAKEHEWAPALALQLKAMNYDAGRALDRIGEGIAGQLKQSIVDLVDPPLAPSTIARKGFPKPLIDKGVLLQSVSHEVVTSPPKPKSAV